MSISKVYSDLIGKIPPAQETSDPEKIAQDELSLQIKMDWLQNPATTELFRDLKAQESQLLEVAILESVKVNTPINTQLIIQCLTRVDTLRKLKNTYGTAARPNVKS